MSIEIKVLGAGDENILLTAGVDVFDNPVDPALTIRFLKEPNHHIVAAIDDGTVVGFASAIFYVHPDKKPELWINEAGVASTHQGQGIGKLLLSNMLEYGRELNCEEAWVLTYRNNIAAIKLYSSVGGKEDPNDVVMFNFNLKK
jgi:ribosomal protein S18 acetylase RimI-like enzyme